MTPGAPWGSQHPKNGDVGSPRSPGAPGDPGAPGAPGQGLTGRVFQLRVGSGSGIGKNYWVGSGSGSGIGNIY